RKASVFVIDARQAGGRERSHGPEQAPPGMHDARSSSAAGDHGAGDGSLSRLVRFPQKALPETSTLKFPQIGLNTGRLVEVLSCEHCQRFVLGLGEDQRLPHQRGNGIKYAVGLRAKIKNDQMTLDLLQTDVDGDKQGHCRASASRSGRSFTIY